MSFRDFTFPEVETQLGLALNTGHLFEDVPPIEPAPGFVERLQQGVDLALGIDTEKARSEFIVAPILLEFRRIRENRNAVFSGVDFNVDPKAGLNGVCDFLISRSPRLLIVTAPVVAVAEAKNDHVTSGLGQCIAGMRAAWLFNVAKKVPVTQVYGASTTGKNWKFLRLRDTTLDIDLREYPVEGVGKILGILSYMVDTA